MTVPRLVPGVIDKYVPAHWQWRRPSHARIDILGLHVPVFPERLDGAERIAEYFRSGREILAGRRASTAFCTDPDSGIRCIDDDNYGASARGANANGVHFEMTGFADQTPEQWMDDYSVATMKKTAKIIALYRDEYDIPMTILSERELRQGLPRGMAKHSTMQDVWGGDERSDPGPNFPDEYFVALCRGEETMAPPLDQWNKVWNKARDTTDADPDGIIEWFQAGLVQLGFLAPGQFTPGVMNKRSQNAWRRMEKAWGYNNPNDHIGQHALAKFRRELTAPPLAVPSSRELALEKAMDTIEAIVGEVG